jgi:hypothetical protein
MCTQSRGGAPASVFSPSVTLPTKMSAPLCSPCHPELRHPLSPDSIALELPHRCSWLMAAAAHVDGSEIGHHKTNKHLYVSPYLTTSRTSSWLVQPKHRHGLATMRGGTVAIPASNTAAFHGIGSISPSSVFRSARSTTTTHRTQLQSNDKQTSATNLELDSAVAMAGAASAVTRSNESDTVATSTRPE